jgi:hypothetical protein
MNIEILFALRALKKVSEIPAQQKIQFDYLNKSYRKKLLRTYKNNALSKYLYLLEIFRIHVVLILKQDIIGNNRSLIALSSTQNQERQIAYIKDALGEHEFSTLNLRSYQKLKLIRNLNLWSFIHSLIVATRLYLALHNKSDAIDLKNSILFICMYVHSKHVLKKHTPHAILVANDHSPIPLGFAGAARTLDIKTIYIQHAHVTPDMPRLRFDVAILDGQCALDTYKKCGDTASSHILFRGIEGAANPMKTKPLLSSEQLTIGVFTNICDEEKILTLTNALLRNPRVDRVIIREHPAFPIRLSNPLPAGATVSGKGINLWEDTDECDIIVGGNSSFHLSVLRYGKPTVFYDRLDCIQYDDYGFIKNNICYECEDMSGLNFTDIAHYYDHKEWVMRFQYFDASYGKDEASLNTAIRNYILNKTLV